VSNEPKDRLNASINVTPLCDIMLVLLIIFMVVTPLIGKGPVNLPHADHSEKYVSDEDIVTLSIRRDGTLIFENRPLVESLLGSKLQAVFETRPDKMLFLKADEDLAYEDVLRVMSACRENGVEEIGLMTETERAGS
jgi:biopolymer transport protein ExbD